MGELELRPAFQDDLAFLDELNTTCMKQYVDPIMEWNPHLFKDVYDPKLVRVVMYGGEPIGMLKVVPESDYLYLGDVMISPNFQNKGFGTTLIHLVLAEAKEAGVPVRLQVLKGNPAKRLYERLGFLVTEEIGMYFRMEKAA